MNGKADLLCVSEWMTRGTIYVVLMPHPLYIVYTLFVFSYWERIVLGINWETNKNRGITEVNNILNVTTKTEKMRH